MVNLRGLGADQDHMVRVLYGDPQSNLNCAIEPECRSAANILCYGPLFFTDKCASWRNYVPTPGEIVANQTNAGGELSEESRDAATRMAQEIIAAEIANHPDRYDALCPSGQIPQPDGSCTPCPYGQTPSDGRCVKEWTWDENLLIAAGVILLAALLIAMKK